MSAEDEDDDKKRADSEPPGEASEPEAEAKGDEANRDEAKGDDADEHDPDPRPYFARLYPDNSELAALVDAFQRGDYAAVRRGAPALAERAGDPDVKRAAEDLVRRTRPDSVSAALVLIGAGLLLFLVYTYWGHTPHDDHNAPSQSGPPQTAPAAPRRSAEAPQ